MDADLEVGSGTVLLPAEAKARGFATPRALRSWCKRNEVTVTRVGRKEFVRSADVDDAITRNAGRGRPSTNANVAAAIAALKGGR